MPIPERRTGLRRCDHTVSRTYAEEIKTPFYGEHLDGLLNARANDLPGIVNGIDYDEYNPETDRYIKGIIT